MILRSVWKRIMPGKALNTLPNDFRSACCTTKPLRTSMMHSRQNGISNIRPGIVRKSFWKIIRLNGDKQD